MRRGILFLALFLVAGLFVAACGDDETPAPPVVPTPTPTPEPEPEPEPELPGVPADLRISATGPDFVEWSWNAVAEVDGYEVQFSADETFGADDETIARTAEQLSYRREGLAPETNAYLRVQSVVGTGEERLVSGWSTHLTGMTQPEPEPEVPPTPTSLTITETGPDFIEWHWAAVPGATGYEVQFSLDETFGADNETIARTAEQLSYRREGLSPETNAYLRVQSVVGTGEERVVSGWSTHLTGMTQPEPEPEVPPTPAGLMIAETGPDFIEWHWAAVPGATGYEAQFSLDEAFGENDETIARTAEQLSYRREGLAPETTAYLRVRTVVGSGEDRAVGGWSTHVTGMSQPDPEPPRPPAPAGLRVTGTGSDFIEWQWNAVAGAAGYEIQFSTDAIFTDDDRTSFAQGTASTTFRVSLEPETTGHLRVRAYTGALNEQPVFGEWSMPSRGVTEEPPPPEPLPAPANLRSTGSDDDSIALVWDAVRGADHYEVEQRVLGATGWGNASCGGGDNEVDGTSCVATELDAGTAHDFRVRAVPDSGDRTATQSAWATTRNPVSTTGRPTPPVSSGGTGSLNVRWTSTADTITWTWDQMRGSTYDIHVSHEGAAVNPDAENPCRGVDYDFEGSHSVSVDVNATAGDIRLLCVRTSNPTNLEENLSWAWGVPAPAALGGTTAAPEDKGRTTSVEWTGGGFAVLGGFSYAFRAVVDPARANDITATTPADEIQAACEAGIAVEDGNSDVDIAIGEVSISRNLVPYAGYLLCQRHENDAGASEWAVPASNAEIATRAAAPPRPVVDPSRTVEAATSTTVVWNVAVRDQARVPREAGEYEAATLQQTERWDHDSNSATPVVSTTAPTVDSCSLTDMNDDSWLTVNRTSTVETTSNGIRVRAAAIQRPSHVADRNLDTDNLRVYLCLRANDAANGGTGPWVITSGYRVNQQPAPQ